MARRTTTARRRSQIQASRNGAPSSPLEPDYDRATALVMEMMAIPGRSGEERQVVEYISAALRRAGAQSEWIQTDRAHQRSPLGGEVGNLICRLPGTMRRPRRMMMAHLDTVPLCVGSQPKRSGDIVRSADPATGLGADDRAGAAVVLSTALAILEQQLPHPPLTLFWPVQEEVGLHGARHATLGQLGRPRLIFNFDGGSPEKLTVGATGAYRMEIDVHGVASHAGGAPEKGVSAVAIAGLALADIHRNGWHGAIHRKEGEGTSNVGVIHGGNATNVVVDRVQLKAEARSHDPEFRRQIAEAIEAAFHNAAAAVTNVDGQTGKVNIDRRHDYDSFNLPPDDASGQAAEAAVRAAGGEPLRVISNGGLDANWMTARGLPTVTLGCGQRNQHMVTEELDLNDFRLACRIALRLATAAENEGATNTR